MEFKNYKCKFGGIEDFGPERPDFDVANAKQRAAGIVHGVELNWRADRRPYYRVWPCVVDMFAKMNLEKLKWSQVRMPVRLLSLSMPRPYWPTFHSVLCCDSRADEETLKHGVGCLAINYNETKVGMFRLPLGEEMTIPESLRMSATVAPMTGVAEESPADPAVELAARLFIGVSCLAGMTDNKGLITPFVINKFRDRYDNAGSQAERDDLVERSARRIGGARGFDVGREMQREINRNGVSPHWRNHHAYFQAYGPGHSLRRLQFGRGTTVNRKALTEVPTGYHDDESRENEQN